MKTMYHVFNAIDWLSIKLNVPCLLVTLFIDVAPALQWMAAIATCSTILYNGIRIYKELKSKSNG
jgi:hypothetical protein